MDEQTEATAGTTPACDGPGEVRGRRWPAHLAPCLAAAFFLGLSAGVLVTVFGMRYVLENFRPEPEQFAERIAERIAGDFRLSDDARDDVQRILADGHRSVMRQVEANFSTIDQIEKEIASRIARHIPEGQARARWSAEYREYFPRPPRPLSIGPIGPGSPGDPGGMNGPDDGLGVPREAPRGMPMPPRGDRPGR